MVFIKGKRILRINSKIVESNQRLKKSNRKIGFNWISIINTEIWVGSSK
jgi:hypothetical protein